MHVSYQQVCWLIFDVAQPDVWSRYHRARVVILVSLEALSAGCLAKHFTACIPQELGSVKLRYAVLESSPALVTPVLDHCLRCVVCRSWLSFPWYRCFGERHVFLVAWRALSFQKFNRFEAGVHLLPHESRSVNIRGHVRDVVLAVNFDESVNEISLSWNF